LWISDGYNGDGWDLRLKLADSSKPCIRFAASPPSPPPCGARSDGGRLGPTEAEAEAEAILADAIMGDCDAAAGADGARADDVDDDDDDDVVVVDVDVVVDDVTKDGVDAMVPCDCSFPGTFV